MVYPRLLWGYIVDLIFPYRCVVCGKYLDLGHLCPACFNALPIKKQNECIGCGHPTILGKTCPFCRGSCATDQLLVVSDYKDKSVSSIIKLLKYRFLSDLTEPLSRLTFKYLDHLARRDGLSIVHGNPLLVAVPLHKNREYWRGFNQAKILAKLIARHYRLDYHPALVRSKYAIPQADLSAKPERQSNVCGLYVCHDHKIVFGRNIILVDDVCTTGATLNECARILKDAGALHVTALAIARG